MNKRQKLTQSSLEEELADEQLSDIEPPKKRAKH